MRATKKINTLILVIIFTITSIVSLKSFANSTGEINEFYVDSTGKVKVTGWFDSDEYDATLLMTDGNVDFDKALKDNDFSTVASSMMHIDQCDLGNNNVYYFRFQLDEKWSECAYDLKIGGPALLTTSGTLREIPSDIYNVADSNAIRIGNDVYDIGCLDYTPNNISESIERGGNKIYYKIEGYWFNMLDPEATSSAYFTSENAIPESEWDAWEIDKYYQY